MPGIHVWLEAQFIKTHLDTLMKWNGIGAKWNELSTFNYLKVKILAREIIMVILILVDILQSIDILVPTSAFRLVTHLGGEKFLVFADMDSGTWYVALHIVFLFRDTLKMEIILVQWHQVSGGA